MADKRAIKVETLDRLGASFQESRGITHKLTTEEMIELAKVPTASGENKLAQLIDGTPIEITASDLGDITKISNNAFYGKRNITSLEIPSTVVSLGDYSFNNMSSTTVLKYDGTVNDWCSKVDISFSGASPLYGNSINTMWFRNNQGEYYEVLDDLIIEEGLPEIKPNSFYNFNRVRNVVIPTSVKAIRFQAFYNCSNIINLTLNEGLETIEGAFNYCRNIQDLIIPNSVKTVGNNAFANSNLLNEVRIGNGITSINSTCFTSCPNLTDIYIDKPEGSISGSPWGASSATIHWNTPLPSEEV